MRKNNLAKFGGTPVRNKPWVWNNLVGEDESRAVEEVIMTGQLSVFRGGPKVKAFENAFANYSGAIYGVATTSGTTALHTAVAALDLKPDDEVLIPSLTFISTASVILQERAKPIFVDIDPTTYCMSPADLEAKISENSRAIIPVHIFGHPADMDSIIRIADNYGLSVIADAAQAHGAKINDIPIGKYGLASCYSFFQTKNMTTGEGGMVITNDINFKQKLQLKREHGSPENPITWYVYTELGFNYAMTEMQAAIGLVQLRKLDRFNQARRKNATTYIKAFSGTKLILPHVKDDITHVFHNFPVLLPEAHIRDEFVEAVRMEGVPIDICYPLPLHKTPLFEKHLPTPYCPVAESITSRIFTLFTDPTLSESDVGDICKAVLKVSEYYLGER